MIRDIAFDDADDVGSIQYRLHPLDVGFDLRPENLAVQLEKGASPLRVSYATRSGERRVVEGPAKDVAACLRRAGYRVVLRDEKP